MLYMCYRWWQHNPVFPFTTRCTTRDTISSYIFVLCLEILFILIKNDLDINGIEIFEYCYLYADKRKVFLKDKHSISYLSEKFKFFTDRLGLKPNTTKSEIAGIGVLKRVQMTVCGMRSIDLRNEATKILGIYFS